MSFEIYLRLNLFEMIHFICIALKNQQILYCYHSHLTQVNILFSQALFIIKISSWERSILVRYYLMIKKMNIVFFS